MTASFFFSHLLFLVLHLSYSRLLPFFFALYLFFLLFPSMRVSLTYSFVLHFLFFSSLHCFRASAILVILSGTSRRFCFGVALYEEANVLDVDAYTRLLWLR